MEARIVTKTELFIVCPFCEKGTSRIDHLDVGGKFGPWYCDECGHAYEGFRTATGAEVTKLDKLKTKVHVLLEYVHDSRLKLVVEGSEYSEFPDSNHAYYYGEHTCPTNYLQRVQQVILRDGTLDDHDPHGVFQFVRVATEKDLGADDYVD